MEWGSLWDRAWSGLGVVATETGDEVTASW